MRPDSPVFKVPPNQEFCFSMPASFTGEFSVATSYVGVGAIQREPTRTDLYLRLIYLKKDTLKIN